MTMETLRSRFAAFSRRDMYVGGAGLCICAVLSCPDARNARSD